MWMYLSLFSCIFLCKHEDYFQQLNIITDVTIYNCDLISCWWRCNFKRVPRTGLAVSVLMPIAIFPTIGIVPFHISISTMWMAICFKFINTTLYQKFEILLILSLIQFLIWHNMWHLNIQTAYFPSPLSPK